MSASLIDASDAWMFSISFSVYEMANPKRFWNAPRSPRCCATVTIACSTTAIVARDVDSVDTEQAKETKAMLEAVIEQDPTQLTPHVLLGMLAYGGGIEELAIQHLLFVATVNDKAGEAFYLSAVASVRR